ncbi:MAG: CoA activase [Spirochaetes bacterium]|nr:CoA activase [Spirochaetota bacterium]
MNTHKNILGIDIGSISLSAALITPQKEIIKTCYSFHNGDIRNSLINQLENIDFINASMIAVTSSSPDVIKNAVSYDPRISVIACANYFHNKPGTILIVGAERFGAVLFDEDGEYLNYRSNSSCAAGTGSFLDQQSKRLNLSGIEEFAEISFNNTGAIPKIASRCAVFAKTDLIHAQQEGYSLSEICDGLSYGCAKNITDVLFNKDIPAKPVIFCGGVSKNKAVAGHIASLLETDLIIDDYSHIYGAVGAALNLIHDIENITVNQEPQNFKNISDIILSENKEKKYYYESLDIKLSNYPDFAGIESYEFKSKLYPLIPPVEIDIYMELAAEETCNVYLGMDIGSTSTKAVIMDDQKSIIAGFYTRTSGRPVEAVQAVFESIHDLILAKNVTFDFMGTGTTGSGRKFIKEVVNADIALDEITAHARAAYELNKDTDTIIEIGGQDSKFTTMRNGMVTFSVMNNVCAAGTGSFIEEQAKKLNCPLSEYSKKAEGSRAPLSSDKCTVFMERDLNYYLNHEYSVNEVLASVLHSVRENYLTKVAKVASIGNTIFFQGATAKNRALVAAFEQKLNKPIMVSKYCHLTGALGIALNLYDEKITASSFRGIEIYKNHIPVKTEVCNFCTNHCKIKLAEINGRTVAFGFLCGRDYDTKKFVDSGAHKFDFVSRGSAPFAQKTAEEYNYDFTVGIPAALHIVEDLPLWKKFFEILSIRTITSEKCKDPVSTGKKIRGAEFCSPVTSLYGHVQYLSDKADYIFLPFYLEEKQQTDVRRQYCYYTQYAPSLISSISFNNECKILNPVIRSINGNFHLKVELYKMIKYITGKRLSFFKISSAYDNAVEYLLSCKEELIKKFDSEFNNDNINIALLGRPYTVLSDSMNSGIPYIFAKLGIRTFFQDMIYDKKDGSMLNTLLNRLHWHFASEIIETTAYIAKTDALYPVLVTSFKCAPDSFVIDCFRDIMDSHNKPYLILQLDEHASNVGYETRIEAGIRAFRNHFFSVHRKQIADLSAVNPVFPSGLQSLTGKTLLLPNFDSISCRLVEASLRKAGIDARLLEENDELIRKSMFFNSGQCLPVNAIAMEAIEYIRKYNLDPEKTVIWMLNSTISCNIGMFPNMIKKILHSFGHGLEKTDVFIGSITYLDLSLKIAVNAYFAYMFGGLLRKSACRLRPYEKIKGSTTIAVEQAMNILYDCFLNDTSKDEALEKIIGLLENIEVKQGNRPKIAIIGDIYARDNHVFNQDLIKTIEDNGGEVISAPYNEYLKIIADPYIQKWFREGLYAEAATTRILKSFIPLFEKKCYSYFNRILKEDIHEYSGSAEEVLSGFNVTTFHTGESMETILKIFSFIDRYPDIALFVQTGPSLCCPSLVTEAMSLEIEKATGVPVVTIEYDGTGGLKNDKIIPYLKYPRKRGKPTGTRTDYPVNI